MIKKPLFSASVLILIAGNHAHGGVIELSATDTGWYNQSGSHIPSNLNYIVGNHSIEGIVHNFSVFDLSSITMPVQSATLRYFNGESPPNREDGYQSPDPFETFSIFNVSTDIGILTGGSGGVAAYTDLGSGTSYGLVDVTAADNGAFVEISLNSDGIAALNASGGLIAFGGNITSLDHPVGVDENVFLFSHQSPDVRLSVTTIPEPGTSVLFGLATIGIGASRRRRR